MPKRIQRRRTKGWRQPKGTVFVGRPSKFGNPYRIDSQLPKHMALPAAVGLFKSYAGYRLESDPHWLDSLKGKDLACWCPLEDEKGNPVPCHADVLIELANRE